MADISIAGVMRAGAYSPNHIGNDTAIFNATVEQLRKRGCAVSIYSEEQFLALDNVTEPVIMSMCRQRDSIGLDAQPVCDGLVGGRTRLRVDDHGRHDAACQRCFGGVV